MSEENLTTADETTENKTSNVTNIVKNTDVKKTLLINKDTSSESFEPSTIENKSLDELLAIAKELLVKTPKMASDQFSFIRKKFYDSYNTEKDQEYEDFKKQKNDDDTDFTFSKQHFIEQIRIIEEQINQALKEEKERIVLEKKNNLALKKKLLVKLEEIVSQDETLETINQVKEIQKEWKAIRILPKESVNELWDKYNLLQNKFYQ